MDRQRLLPVLDQHWILGARDSRRIYRRAYPGEHTLPRRHRMFRSDLLSVGRHSRVDEPQRLVLRCRVPCAGRAPRRSNRPDFQGFHQVVSDHRWNLPGARRPGALVRAWCRCTKLPSGNWDFPPSSPCLSWSFLNRRQPLTSRALPYSLGPSTRPSQTPPTTANRQPHPAPRTRPTATARPRATPSAKHPTPFRQRAAGTWPRRAACDAVGAKRRAGPDRPFRPHAAPLPRRPLCHDPSHLLPATKCHRRRPPRRSCRDAPRWLPCPLPRSRHRLLPTHRLEERRSDWRLLPRHQPMKPRQGGHAGDRRLRPLGHALAAGRAWIR